MQIEIISGPIQARHAIVTFSGWADAGKLIEHIVGELRGALSWSPAAIWDLDGFWHTEAVRPEVFVEHGQIRSVEWPSYRFDISARDGSDSILLGSGPEPSLNWRTFARDLLHLLKEWGCGELILLGSLFDQIFHDEILISSIVQDAHTYNILRELGCRQAEYTGPSAIHSIVMDAARETGISCMSVWAHLPFYLNGPHELLMARFLHVLGRLLHFEFDESLLVERWKEREQMIQDLLQQDPDLRQSIESIRKGKQVRGGPEVSSKVVRFDDFIKKRQDTSPDEE